MGSKGITQRDVNARVRGSGSKAVTSAFWYTASNLFVKALGFVTIPVFTRLLTQEEFGAYNNYLAWLAVMTIVVSFTLEATIISAKVDFGDDLESYVLSMCALSMTSAVVWLLASIALAGAFGALMALDAPYVWSMFVYLMFFPAITLFQTWERFMYRYKVTVAISVGLAVGMAGLAVALVVVLPVGLDGAIYGRVIPAVLIGAGVLVWLLSRGARVRAAYWRYALPIALPYIPHLLSMTLLGALNRMFITQMCGAEANALYGLAYNCGLIMTIFITSLNGAFSPWLGDKLAGKDYGRIRRVARPYIALFCALAVLVSLLAPEVLLVLGGEAYLEAVWVIPPISMGCVFQFVYTMYVNVEQFEKKTVGMALASASAAALNAGLDVALIPALGYVAAGYATAASYLWLMAAHMLLVRRMGMSGVYDNRANALIALATCALIAGVSLLYGMAALRWALCAAAAIALAVILARRRGQVLSFLK